MAKSRNPATHFAKLRKRKSRSGSALNIRRYRWIKKKTANQKDGAVGKFSDTPDGRAIANYCRKFGGVPYSNGHFRSFPPETIRAAIVLGNEVGNTEASKRLGIKCETIENWRRKRFLQKTGKYTFPKMLEVIRMAMAIQRAEPWRVPMTAILFACDRLNMDRNMVKKAIYMQAMPTLPGFQLYADPHVNLMAELYGRGERNYANALGIDHPKIPAWRRNDGGRTGKSSVPRQKGRRFVVELQVSRPRVSRKQSPS